MIDFYILDDQNRPIRSNVEEAARWLAQNEHRKRVAWTDIEGVQVSVSTVFMTLDHQYSTGPPLVFETMVFWTGDFGGLEHDDMMRRYSTWEQAEQGHNETVVAVRRKLLKAV